MSCFSPAYWECFSMFLLEAILWYGVAGSPLTSLMAIDSWVKFQSLYLILVQQQLLRSPQHLQAAILTWLLTYLDPNVKTFGLLVGLWDLYYIKPLKMPPLKTGFVFWW